MDNPQDNPLKILNCEMAFVCHKKWEELDPTDRWDVKNCSACKKEVYFCKSSEELKEKTEQGVCVAFATMNDGMMGAPLRRQAF
jgi:hypothetical protein